MRSILKADLEECLANIHLREAYDKLEFCFYLANIETSIEGGVDEFNGGDYDELPRTGSKPNFHQLMEDTTMSSMGLKIVVRLNGTKITQGILFDEDAFIQENPFKDKTPDKDDYSGFTGNEGTSATHFYHRTVAIITPLSHRMELLFPNIYGSHDIRKDSERNYRHVFLLWLDSLSKKISSNSGAVETREKLLQLTKMIIRRTKVAKTSPSPDDSWQHDGCPYPDEVMACIITIAIELDEKDVSIEGVELCPHDAQDSTFYVIGTGLHRYDPTSLLPTLFSLLTKITHVSPWLEIVDQLRAGFEQAADQHPLPDSDIVEFQT